MTEVNSQLDEKDLFEIYRESMASIGKAQSRYVASLFGFLALLWGTNFVSLPMTSHGEVTTVQLSGLTLSRDGLWMITPAVLTVLTLGLIGSVNIMGIVWARLNRS